MGHINATLAIPPELKEQIRAMKVIPEETFASVLRRIIEQAERVPALEKRIQELKDENEKLKEENTDLDQRVEELMSGELD